MAGVMGNAEFIAYCLEEFKAAEQLTGKTAIGLFAQYKIMDYLTSSYEALHTTGGAYIANDIRAFIDARHKADFQL
jgi:hypothetical protein